ncbi:MAG: OPT/YSL family transporter, partial [Ignisphaera sp.]
MPNVTNVWLGSWYNNFTFVVFWPLIISLIGALVNKIGGNIGLNKQELTVIATMIHVSWIVPTFFGVIHVITMLGTARQIPAFHRWNLEYARNVNWMWGPDPFNDRLWESWMYGGPVPWAEWMPALLFHIVRLIPYYLSFAFLVSLFRRQFVDLEALPFPHAMAIARLIDMTYEKVDGKIKLFDNVWLWLGLLIGFLAIFPFWGWTLPGLGLTVPVFPNHIGIDLTHMALVPLGAMSFTFEAFWIGAALLVPAKTLFSYIVTSVAIHWIWWPMMVYLGYWETHSAGATDIFWVWRGWSGPMMQAWVRQWGAIVWVALGVGFGTVFYPIFVSFRREFVNNVKALFGKAPAEVEEREPMKYRYMLLGYIVCLVAYITTWWWSSLGNLPMLFAFVWTIANGLFFVVRSRVAGEYGIAMDVVNCNVFAHNWDTVMREWWVADPVSPCYIKNLQARFLVLRNDYPWFTTFTRAAPAHTLLEAYKIGSLEGVHSRYIFAGCVIAIIIGIIVSLFTLLPMWCSFGALNLSAFNYTGAPHNYHQRGPTYACITETGDYWRGGFIAPPVATSWLQFIVGVILASIIWVLHTRYPWFPINPG